MHTHQQYWLILLVIIPQVTETIYAASLPTLASSFSVSEQLAQWTLPSYLLGFAVGVRLWGHLSDRFGQSLTLSIGYSVYSFMCCLAAFSTAITWLYPLRFFQGLFISIASVVPQSIAMRTLSTRDRGHFNAMIGQGVAIAPALGPIIGIELVQLGAWPATLLGMALLGLGALWVITTCLSPHGTQQLSHGLSSRRFWSHAWPYVMINGLAISTGFYFFNQSGFYCLEVLKMNQDQYQYIFPAIAVFWFFGGRCNSALLRYFHCSHQQALRLGATYSWIMASLALGIFYLDYLPTDINLKAWLSVGLIGTAMLGVSSQVGNAITLGLAPFQNTSGEATSRFAFGYYTITASTTYLAILAQQGSVYDLPLGLWVIYSLILVLTLAKPHHQEN